MGSLPTIDCRLPKPLYRHYAERIGGVLNHRDPRIAFYRWVEGKLTYLLNQLRTAFLLVLGEDTVAIFEGIYSLDSIYVLQL
jgi:hypothetical protein